MRNQKSSKQKLNAMSCPQSLRDANTTVDMEPRGTYHLENDAKLGIMDVHGGAQL
jgi:hypothetical protein